MKKKKFNIPIEVSFEVTDVRICDPETLETFNWPHFHSKNNGNQT